MSLNNLVEKLENRSALIGIIGLGYVGLPLMLRFSEVGYRVLGIDIDPDKVSRLNKGESYISYIPSQPIAAALKKGCLLYTSPSPRDRTRSRMPSSA